VRTEYSDADDRTRYGRRMCRCTTSIWFHCLYASVVGMSGVHAGMSTSGHVLLEGEGAMALATERKIQPWNDYRLLRCTAIPASLLATSRASRVGYVGCRWW